MFQKMTLCKIYEMKLKCKIFFLVSAELKIDKAQKSVAIAYHFLIFHTLALEKTQKSPAP